MDLIYNYPNLYNWYLNRRLAWIENFRRTTFIDTINKYVSDGDLILDIACGTGINCILLSQKFPNSLIVGIDQNKSAINYSRQLIKKAKIKNIRFVQTDIAKFSLQSFSEMNFSVITCTLGLSVIKEWEKAIYNTDVILNPGGIFVVLDLYFPKNTWRLKLSHLWINSLFNAYHDRLILDVLKEKFNTLEILKEKSIFLFIGQKRSY